MPCINILCSNVLVIRTYRKPYGHTKKINCVLPSYKINWDVQRNLRPAISTSYKPRINATQLQYSLHLLVKT